MGRPPLFEKDVAMCHECKTLKDKKCLAKCTFDSKQDGMWKPNSLSVNGVSICNADPLQRDYVCNLVRVR